MDSPNPYEAPIHIISAEDPYGTEVSAPLATRGQRFANLVIDAIGFYVFAFAVGMALAVLNLGHLLEEIPELLFSMAVMLAYYFPLELIAGRTIGKFITGTKVVAEPGKTITAGRILGRTFARFIPFEPFSFLSDKPIGWHDSLSGTRVIQCR